MVRWWLAAWAGAWGSAVDAPGLTALAVRFSDCPVTLRPQFRASVYIYQAVLDFSMNSFAVDAAPKRTSKVVNSDELWRTKLIEPGTSARVDVHVRSTLGTEIEATYSIIVARQNGTDNKLRALTVEDGSFTPTFNPRVEDYIVNLPASSDAAALQFTPMDTGQSIQIVSVGGTERISRRLEAQPQHRASAASFPISVGQSRTLKITVHPANEDPDPRHWRSYTLKISRAPCPPAAPLFAPDMGACSPTCNDGYFRDYGHSRCGRCAPLCLKCSRWSTCLVCEPSSWTKFRFITKSEGFCREVQVPWSYVIASSAAVIVTLATCCLFCCRAQPYGKRRIEISNTESDSDLDMQ
mmetsp:Transcript_32456/g.77969  ORF Transcript_32456/g.77969 Transcript_32456/m.77969 type:complete len:353 (-) Transcript_32456:88-1146(-)